MKNISGKQKELIFKCKSYGITMFLVVAASLTFYFLIDKPDNIIGAVTNVFSILSPVITGIVFAFILNPIMMFYRKYFDLWFTFCNVFSSYSSSTQKVQGRKENA